jgi:hypothetical protein
MGVGALAVVGDRRSYATLSEGSPSLVKTHPGQQLC